VKVPFFVLHGEADTVTDPEVSRALYERAGSSDKKMKLYPGMWHGLTSGEPDDNVEAVFADIVTWLDDRARDGAWRVRVKEASLLDDGVIGTPVVDGRRERRPRRTGRFHLCGWKGRMHQYHSSMWATGNHAVVLLTCCITLTCISPVSVETDGEVLDKVCDRWKWDHIESIRSKCDL